MWQSAGDTISANKRDRPRGRRANSFLWAMLGLLVSWPGAMALAAADADPPRLPVSSNLNKLPDSPIRKPGLIRRGADGRLQLDSDPVGRQLVICSPGEDAGSGCTYKTLATAVRAARYGDVIIIRPGIYQEAVVILESGLTLRGEPGAHLRGRAAERKAALVIKGDDTVIEGLECSNINVRDRNGACVRLQGRNLTLRNVYFHDAEQGLLAGRGTGTVVIEDSRFERLGRGGRAHGIYLSGGDLLIVRRSRFLSTKGEGHGIKSRARRTIIEDSVIASLDGDDSRLIDLANGGEIIIRNNVLEEGPNSRNWNLIGIGFAKLHERNSALIEGNIIIADHARAIVLKSIIPTTVRNNIVIGASPLEGQNNRWYADRQAAGLAPYPALPAPGWSARAVK